MRKDSSVVYNKQRCEKTEELTSDPDKEIPRDWVADHGAVRRLGRAEGAGIGGDGGDGEGGAAVAEDA